MFVAKVGDEIVGRPLKIEIPQYAYLTQADSTTRTAVVVIQAEHAQGMDLVGYREVETGTGGVATLPELILLGSIPPSE